MNKVRKITENIYSIHANLPDLRLFEGFWKIPHGVSLNSYVVKGEGENAKNVLIDLVWDCQTAVDQLYEQLKSINVTIADIDYLVLNHLEPDHAGFIQKFFQENTKATIYTTQKGVNLLDKFFKVQGRCHAIKDQEILELGGQITLQFFETPNVHWPETMMTYEQSSQTLFSCDAFGSYGTIENKVIDNELTKEEHSLLEHEMLRYYSNIVSSFSPAVNNALKKLTGLPVKYIAPSHGLIWQENPTEVINRYKKYAGYTSGGELEKEVCVIWGSMYGSTDKGALAIIEGLKEAGIPYSQFKVPESSYSEILASALGAKILVLGIPTYEYKMYPPMAHLLDLFARKHFFKKTAFRFGSWGWLSNLAKDYDAATSTFSWNHLPAYEWQGIPTNEDLQALKQKAIDLKSEL
ncbi:MAG: FprA family A-type flavoprotein [Treponemataceae bacterium]